MSCTRLKAAPVVETTLPILGQPCPVLQARIDAAGLGRTLVRLVADNPDQAQMVLGSIAFVDWLALVSSLQSDHIRMDNGRVEALSAPGLVGVSATFIRARNP